MIAYPLLMHSVKQLRRYREGKLTIEADKKDRARADLPAEAENIF